MDKNKDTEAKIKDKNPDTEYISSYFYLRRNLLTFFLYWGEN